MSNNTTHELENRLKQLEEKNSLLLEEKNRAVTDLQLLEKTLAHEKTLKQELNVKNKELSEISRIDGLTSLYNHRYIMERCDYEFKRSNRYSTPLTCVMFDIDHFKLVNDTYGHQFGDFILSELSSLLKKESRTVDICGRYGGEEFMVLVALPLKKTYEYIARFHRTVEDYAFISDEHHLKITISVGIAEYDKDLKSYQDLVAKADHALYQAKAGGRNIICTWTEEAEHEVVIDNEGIVNLKNKCNSLSRKMKETYLQSTDALLRAIDARDHYTLLHSTEVAKYAVQIAQALKLAESEVEIIKCASLLHDIGKIGIEEHILIKRERLSQKEQQIMRKHSTIGVDILKDVSFLSREIPFILHHHEHFDGSGYPHGLQDRSIPLGAKIITIADSYVAMTTDRNFQAKKTPSEAVTEMLAGRSKQFDPALVDIFIQTLETN